jgi:nucleotide-binding universal stress UspA family protein
VDTAVFIAEKLEASVLFLNVVNERLFSDLKRASGRVRSLDGVFDQSILTLEQERAQQMKDILKQSNADKIIHESKIAVGLPYDVIIKTAEKEKIDLIIMGAKGHDSLSRRLRFGSSAEKVFRRSSCRVMFVR